MELTQKYESEQNKVKRYKKLMPELTTLRQIAQGKINATPLLLPVPKDERIEETVSAPVILPVEDITMDSFTDALSNYKEGNESTILSMGDSLGKPKLVDFIKVTDGNLKTASELHETYLRVKNG